MKQALVTGIITRGKLTAYDVYNNPLVAHYLTDGDYAHPGKCFDKFLDDQWDTGAYELASEFDTPHDAVWHAIIEVGGWTVEWNYIEEIEPADAKCVTCGKGFTWARST